MATAAALLDSPAVGRPTQLWFDWEESAASPSAQPSWESRPSPRRAEPLDRRRRLGGGAAPGTGHPPAIIAVPSPGSREAGCRDRYTDEGSRRRGGQAVRMGELMIQLLKSYGITDAEIAEGMEAYAAAQ